MSDARDGLLSQIQSLEAKNANLQRLNKDLEARNSNLRHHARALLTFVEKLNVMYKGSPDTKELIARAKTVIR